MNPLFIFLSKNILQQNISGEKVFQLKNYHDIIGKVNVGEIKWNYQSA
ncbi:hypothetical protein BAT_2938 [Bacillus pumilus ATCC 7061]|nr:hypothetical protein BAT_2938 [Bacillus pumilus ATCC 7061]